MKKFKSIFALVLMSTLITTSCSPAASKTQEPTVSPESSDTQKETKETKETSQPDAKPINITMAFSDNATLPMREDWLSLVESEKFVNANVEFEIIPIADYVQKTSLALNSGDAPDVILGRDVSKGEMAALALNGLIAPVSDYSEYTPNFNKKVEDWGLTKDVEDKKLKDGKLYFLPSLFDKPFYDGGLILREDFLEANSLKAPTTFEELYEILKVYKTQNPSSFPLTTLVEPRVLYRMSMPSFGISLGKNSASGSFVLSWDYEQNKYFAGATSDNYKAYVEYMARLYKEGLLDPEMKNSGDAWTAKMATGKSIASYAYYDQIGGIVGSSEIEGIKLNLYPPLVGSDGAHHQEKNRLGLGALFPIKTSKRDDFKEVVGAVDKMFYSPEMATLWCLGVEGQTFNKEGDKITFPKEITDSKDGIYKTLQLKYGLGVDGLQFIWENSIEMSKYDENYAQINKVVAGMPNAIQSLPPYPKFDDMQAEEIGLMQAPLLDTFEIWANDFFTGQKSVEKDWDAYVAEMKSKKIDELLALYNDNL